MVTIAQINAHREAVAVAKGALQTTLAGNPSVAAAKAAHITYQKAVLASARTNGHMTGALNALLSLHADVTDGVAGDT